MSVSLVKLKLVASALFNSKLTSVVGLKPPRYPMSFFALEFLVN